MTTALQWFEPRYDKVQVWFDEHPEFLVEIRCQVSTEFAACYVQIGMNADEYPDGGAGCLEAAWKALEILAHGLRTHIRVSPEVQFRQEFMSMTNTWCGYVRFCVCSEEGPWLYPPPHHEVRYLGFSE